ncbi:cation diffusion facilitator family transporter [Albimonas pacifica]|uniref:Cobalt-zinc-cadmium efflux system protein n=1 Tax=Albimonas pacifica TaxID=1114924 RepID=A0A1I3FM93_9RHOB|nr:cation diffusion facilitator family transporter [Albimonas pacifica]SFI12232.1 cobalt-zinc-cadmium efflux system protein [Albimonas pacifica]
MAHDHAHSSQGHGHGHAHGHLHAGDGRIGWAAAVNIGLTVVQIVAGMLSGSLMLIADALHNLSDAMSLIIAWAARRIARRPADDRMTFGYARAEVVAALINFTTLIVVGLYLAWEAIARMFDPQPIEGWTVVIVAGVALVIDAITAALVYAQAKDSLNMRAAFLHNLADAGASVAVILGGIVVIVWDWRMVDPLLTLLISAWVLRHALLEMGETVRILMNAAPDSPSAEEARDTLAEIEAVASVHHLHLWRLDERRLSLEAHLVSHAATPGELAALRQAARAALDERHGIKHATLEIEHVDDACEAREGGAPSAAEGRPAV